MKKQKEKEFEICTLGSIVSYYSVWAKSKKEAERLFWKDRSVNFVSSDETFDEEITEINEGDDDESN